MARIYHMMFMYPALSGILTLPDGDEGIPYAGTIAGVGGSGSYTYTKSVGPAWMSVHATTGAITGTPNVLGTNIPVSILITDSSGSTVTISDTMDVTAITLWTPASLANLYAWFISDHASNTYSGGEYLSMFDVSGNGRTANRVDENIPTSVGIDGRQTVNATQAGGEDHFFTVNASTAFSQNRAGVTLSAVYAIDPDDGVATARTIVVQETNASGSTRCGLDAGGTAVANQPRAYGRRQDAEGSSTIVNAGSAKASATVSIGIFDYTNGTIYMSSDGTVTSGALPTSGNSSNTASFNPVYICQFPLNNNKFRGHLGEVVLTTNALSSTDREKLEGYLAWQWGLEGSLPALHPYKTYPPFI